MARLEQQTEMIKQRIQDVLLIKELLAALKAVVDDYEMLLGDGMTKSTEPPQLTAALAAIAKAEGRG